MLNTLQTIRGATVDDAKDLAQLVNHAGEGMPHHYWRSIGGPDADPWEIGIERARRESGAFCYRKATMIELGGRVAGALISYPVTETTTKDDYASMPPLFVPLQELEDQAVGTHYINVLAVHPALRGRGLGGRLLQRAEDAAKGRTMSLVVSDANVGARRLYERTGYRLRASRPAIKDGWDNPVQDWLLMVKEAT